MPLPDKPADDSDEAHATLRTITPEVERYGSRYVVELAPDNELPEKGMPAREALDLIEQELLLDGVPGRNLATFVTTWMEPEAEELIKDTLRINFIDHAEYPRSAEIEQRCIRMIANLFHAPGKTTGARTQGSSEAIMLGALSLKWKWRERRQAAGQPTDKPNLVFGADVHVVWDKFCRYFDVEARVVPLQPGKFTMSAEDFEPHIDENTIGVAAVLGTTFTGHSDDITGINDMLVQLKQTKGLDVPMHVDGASGGFVWPFLYPHKEWDFRLEQVRSINVSGHKFGLVYPGVGWLVFREESDLAKELVFMENYLGREDATFTLNFSTGDSMMLAQYYNFLRLGFDGYRAVMEAMKLNARNLAKEIEACGRFELVGTDEDEQLPLVAFKLADTSKYDEFDVAAQLASIRGWLVPAYTMPPNAQDVKVLRVLVKETLGAALVQQLGRDIEQACETLDEKGGMHPHERRRVRSNPSL
jgi:glutamate decarboxylase